ncbi:MAG: DUF4258 domain-containing protein [Alphaproteobacteria bacterium]|uniref:DUF4258 domain-containing protein n=1 Tax=Candidatus Nitrobium versatile TaxID=2884831 RepID=A0A953M2V5_9BACT|nr:DUF4258 domain-containing protein [Candidatus Nitrobium versatile]
MQKKYSKAEALKLIRKLSKNGLILSGHVKQRMVERNFQTRDVLQVIESGAIYSEPEIHSKTGRWTYKVEGKTLDGERLHVLIDIREEDNCIVILTGTT